MDVFYECDGKSTTYKLFNHQVCQRARTLHDVRGQTVGLWANNGSDFVINLFALWAAGAVPVLPSRRLNLDMVAALLDEAGATALIAAPNEVEGVDCRVLDIACVAQPADAQDEPAVEIGHSSQHVAVILHTSGTTDRPKLVPITRDALLASLEFEAQSWGTAWTSQDASAGWLPLFHAYGLISELLQAFQTRSTYYFAEPTPPALLNVLRTKPITTLFSVPWMVQEIMALPGGIDALSGLRRVVVSGAALNAEFFDGLSDQGVSIVQQWGMTELGAGLRSRVDGDWRDMVPVISDTCFDLDPTGQLLVQAKCPALTAPTAMTDFTTKDMFERTASGAYRYVSRIDDVLVHVSGEKSNALTIEQQLLAKLHDCVNHLCVIGDGRLRLGCVVSWKTNPVQDDFTRFAQACAEVNGTLPGHSRIHQDLVLFLTAENIARLPISPKGTVGRKALEQEFKAEIDALYERADQGTTPVSDRPQTTAQIRKRINAVLLRLRQDGLPRLVSDQGFVEQGVDSLMAVQIRAHLQTEFGLSLPRTLLFDFPSVDALVSHFSLRLLGAVSSKPATARPESAVDEPIAIVGAACRLPGAADLDAFWQLLNGEPDTVSEVPPNRWDPAVWYDPDPNKPGRSYVKSGSFLDNIEAFDASFFRISPREANRLDPQQRLLLEVGWEALENAGTTPCALKNCATAVFVGASTNEYGDRQGVGESSAGYFATGTAPSMMAGRLSYFLGLNGPSLTVDTACSSSLTAVHLACQSLRLGECDRALVGGVNLLLSPKSFVALSRLRALSPDGRSKPFAEAADGFGRAEGCAVTVLKRLSDAQRDNDQILAVIRGTATNHGGHSSGLTVPSGAAQQDLLRAALERSGLDAASVDMIECHGSGTPLGDPIEVNAIAEVYDGPRAAPLVLSAVKASVGHLEAAAGIASLLKVVLALRHETIPAQRSFGALNTAIPWNDIPVTVPQSALPWRQRDDPRRAGVSAFGLSGANAHVIVEEAPTAQTLPPNNPDRAFELCVLSASSPAALRQSALRLRDQLQTMETGTGTTSVYDLARSMAMTRAHLRYRLPLVTSSCKALVAALDEAAERLSDVPAVSGREKELVFVFPGQGAQWVGMGRGLMADEPVFRDAMTAYDVILQAETGWSAIELLNADDPTDALEKTSVIQPLLFLVQLALVDLWRSWGAVPSAVVGHSMGEVAAACAAGALSVRDAVRVIVHRSQLLMEIHGAGAMALVELDTARAESAISKFDGLSVAVNDSPNATIIAGPPEPLSQCLAALEQQDVFCRRIAVDVASHSPQVDPLLDPLRSALADIQPGQAHIPMLSTVTASWLKQGDIDVEYWCKNLRDPVRFHDGINVLLAEGYRRFVEVSPHPLLIQSIDETAQASGHRAVAVGSLRRDAPERASLLAALGTLYADGVAPDWKGLFPFTGPRIPLPTYPWQKDRYWSETRHASFEGQTGEVDFSAADATQKTTEPTLSLQGLSGSDRLAATRTFLLQEVARILEFKPSQVDCAMSLQNLGLDSLSAAQLRNRIRSNGAAISLGTILRGASVESLAVLITNQLGSRGQESQPQVRKTRNSDPWLVVPEQRPDAALHLVCFPYAGGGPSVFAGWAREMPGAIQLSAVQLPGHGERVDEAPYTRMEDMADALMASLNGLSDQPIAFLGHSFGAILMFETACRLRDQGLDVEHLFVSGARAPSCYSATQHQNDIAQFSKGSGTPSHMLQDDELLEMIGDLGQNVHAAIGADAELRATALRCLRADLEANNSHLYCDTAPLSVPITAVGGRTDHYVNAAQLFAWRAHSTADFSAHFRAGGHFYFNQDRAFWIDLVGRTLLPPGALRLEDETPIHVDRSSHVG